MSSPLRGALALRAQVLRRRFGSPLEAVLLLVAAAIAWRLGPRLLPWVDAALVALVLLGGTAAHRLLYGSSELALLLPAGLDARALVRLRAVELGALLGATLVPVAALLAGAVGPEGLVALGLLPGLAGAALLVGWTLGRLGPRGRVTALLLGLAAQVATIEALRQGASGPVAAAARSLGGGAPAPFVMLLLGGAGCLVVALLVAPLGHESGLTRAALRDPTRRRSTWRALARGLAPLGRQSAGLLARDLTLLARGALPRGLVIIVALPVVAGLITTAVRADRSLTPGMLELVALLVVAIASAAAGFLFGLDLPRVRRAQLVLERASPLPGARVALARTAGAVLAGAPAVVAVVVAVARDADPTRAAIAPLLLVEAVLVLACIAHDAVGYGLRAECTGEAGAATGYPVRAAPLVVALGVGVAVHPVLIVLYPLLGYAGEARASARRWERDEVQPERAGAA